MTPRMFNTRSLASWMAAGLLVLAPLWQGGCSKTQDANSQLSYENAEDYSWDAGATRTPTAKTIYAMARILSAKGQDAKAAMALAKVIDDSPKFMPAYVEMAQVYLRLERIDMAIATLRRGLEISKDDPVLLNDLGMCHLLRNEPDQAIDCFKQAVAASPRDGRFQSNLAVAHGMKGEYDQALEAYAQVMPESDAHYNVAVLCESRNDHERAQAEYGQAMVLRVMARDTGTPTTGPAGASPEETSAPAPGQVVAQPTTPQPPDQAPPQSTTPPLTPSPDFGEPK